MFIKVPAPCKITFNMLCIIIIINSTLSELDLSTAPVLIEKNSSRYKIHNVKSRGRIIGGVAAKRGQFPYQVSLQYNYVDGFNICGGSILNAKIVVTAAHCVYGHSAEEVFAVVAGISMLSDKNHRQVREVAGHTIHPDWDPVKNSNDIALLIIRDVFKFDRNIQPINYATEPAYLMGCVTTGWGATDVSGKNYPEQLYALILEIQNSKRCLTDFPYDYNNESEICAGGLPGKDTCNGDSGGPLVCNNLLYGITSYGSRECAIGQAFLSWKKSVDDKLRIKQMEKEKKKNEDKENEVREAEEKRQNANAAFKCWKRNKDTELRKKLKELREKETAATEARRELFLQRQQLAQEAFLRWLDSIYY